MPWIDVDQRKENDVWLVHRTGCVTASRLGDVMSKLKRGEGYRAERLNYMKEKRREWLTGRAAEHYVSPWMDRGIQNEGLAVEAYQIETGNTVSHGGIYVHDGISRFMASPDGRVGEDGLVEAKYLTGATTKVCHEDLLDGADVPDEFILQMQGQMACSGRKWDDFVSYDGSMPEKLQLFIKRFERDEKLIAAIEFEVITFLHELVEMLLKLGIKAGLPSVEELDRAESEQLISKMSLSIAEAKGIIP